jgi:hypothetical protein
MTVNNLLCGTSNRWFNLGLQLNIGMEQLQKIKSNNRDSKSCHQEMLLMWLDSSPTWEGLASALEKDSVGREEEANEIRKRFNISKEETDSCECGLEFY